MKKTFYIVEEDYIPGPSCWNVVSRNGDCICSIGSGLNDMLQKVTFFQHSEWITYSYLALKIDISNRKLNHYDIHIKRKDLRTWEIVGYHVPGIVEMPSFILDSFRFRRQDEFFMRISYMGHTDPLRRVHYGLYNRDIVHLDLNPHKKTKFEILEDQPLLEKVFSFYR